MKKHDERHALHAFAMRMKITLPQSKLMLLKSVDGSTWRRIKRVNQIGKRPFANQASGPEQSKWKSGYFCARAQVLLCLSAGIPHAMHYESEANCKVLLKHSKMSSTLPHPAALATAKELTWSGKN